jgi:hypothetical protein
MMNRLIAMLLVAFVSVGCSLEKGSSLSPGPNAVSLVPSSSGQPGPASLVTGIWTGTATASHGESGSLTATFTQPPTADQAVSATIAWTSATSSLVFNGVLTGTIDNLNIDATNLPGGCTYKAVGALNQAGTVITGTYTATGPGSCPQKTGSFTLSGGSYVPPVVVVDVCPNLEGNQASVPAGYQLVEGQCTVIVIPPTLACTESFWQMNQGSSNASQNACENRGGIFLGEWTTYTNVCKFAPNPPGNPGTDITLLLSVPIACPIIN